MIDYHASDDNDDDDDGEDTLSRATPSPQDRGLPGRGSRRQNMKTLQTPP